MFLDPKAANPACQKEIEEVIGEGCILFQDSK